MTVGGSSQEASDDARLCLKKAAEELADKLEQLATQLATTTTPHRVPLGRGGIGFLRSRSPRGFVISRHDLEVLLPDGRIWTEGLPRPDGRRSGRYIDVRATSDRGDTASRMTVAGEEFAYLGVSVGGYAFGAVDLSRGSECRLRALVSGGQGVSLVDADEALDAIAHRAVGGKRRD